jgi:hypothetical protein
VLSSQAHRRAKSASQSNCAARLFIPHSPLAQTDPVEKNPHRNGFYFSKSNGKKSLPFDLKM